MATTLKLDYDGIDEDDVSLIFYHRGWLLEELGMSRLEASRTARGFHVEVDIDRDLSGDDVIVAQLLMGSDLYREIYNFLHNADGQLISQWNKLFDKKFIIVGTKLKEISRETPYPSLTGRLKEQAMKKPRLWRGVKKPSPKLTERLNDAVKRNEDET